MKHLRNRVLAGAVALVMLVTAVITDSRPVLAEDKASSHAVETLDTAMPVEETGEKKADERNVGPERDEEAMAHTLTPETKEEMVPDYPQVDPATDEIKSTVAPDEQKQSTTTDTVSQPMTKEKKEEADAPNTEKNVDKEKATATAGSFSYDFDVKWNNGISADVKDYHYEEDGEGNPDRSKLIFHPVNQSVKTAILRYELDINGDANTVLPPGAIKIKVPNYLFEAWGDPQKVNPYRVNDGKTGFHSTLKWQIPPAPERSTISDFNYSDNGDGTYTVTNWNGVSGGSKLSFEQSFSFRPHLIRVDENGSQAKSVSATLSIDANGDVTSNVNETKTVYAEIHTKTDPMTVELKPEHLTSEHGVYFSWMDSWGQKPQDADNYFYVVWYADVTHPRNNTIPFDYEVKRQKGDGELIGAIKAINYGVARGFTEKQYLDQITDVSYSEICKTNWKDLLQQVGLFSEHTFKGVYPDFSLNGIYDHKDMARFSLLYRYPMKMIKEAKERGVDLVKEGLPLTETVDIYTRTANGHEQRNDSTATQNIHVYPFGGINQIWKYDANVRSGGSTIQGARAMALDGYERLLRVRSWLRSFQTHVTGTALSKPIYIPSTNNQADDYRVTPYTSVITEGEYYDSAKCNISDYYHNQKNAMRPYEDGDITYESVAISLTARDGKYSKALDKWNSAMQEDQTHKRSKPVEIWVRKTGESSFNKYGAIVFDSKGIYHFTSEDGQVKVNNAKGKDIPLPKDTAGLQYRYTSEYYTYDFYATTLIKLNATEHVKKLLQEDIKEDIKNKKNKEESRVTSSASVAFSEESGSNGKNAKNANTEGQPTVQSTLRLGDIFTTFTNDKHVQENTLVDDTKKALQSQSIEISFRQWSSLNDSGVTEKGYLKNYIYPEGTLYDLLPAGTQVDTSSLTLRVGSYWSTTALTKNTDYSIKLTPNWQGLGQTMLEVHYKLPAKLTDGNQLGNHDWLIRLNYTMLNSYMNIVDHGNSVVNTCALKIDPSGTNNLVFEPADQVEKNFNKLKNHGKLQSLVGTDFSHWRFVDATIAFNRVTVTQSGVVKKVQAKNDAVEKDQTHAAIGVPYQYRLGYGTASNTRTDRLVFFDILDQGSRHGKTREDSDWQGVFDWVDVSSITNKPAYGLTGEFANPVIYYATTIPKGYDLGEVTTTGEKVWSTSQPKDKSSIKAIAVDCTKTNKGNDFILDQGASVSVYVHMTAPNDAALDGKTAVNETVSYARNFAGEKASANLETKEYTANAKITLHKPDLSLTKSSRPVSGTAQAPTEIDNKKDMLVEYTLTVKNNRTNNDAWATVKDVLLKDAIPAHLMVDRNKITVVKSTEQDKKLSLTDAKIGLMGKGQDLQFHIPELAPGESLTFTIPTTLDAVQKQTTRFENTASITEVDGVKTNINSETTYHQVTVDIDIPVTKVWKDYDGSDPTTTPDKVTVALFGDQKQLETLDLEKKDSWKGTFKDVPSNDPKTGKPYTFTVKEVGTTNGLIQIGNDWYTASVVGDQTQGFTVTNTKHQPWTPIVPTTSLTVTKAWSGVARNYYDAASVTVELYKNGQATGMKATLNKANQFTATFKGLLTVDDVAQPQQNQYTVKELDANGKALADGGNVTILNKDYTVRYGQVADGKQTITNTLVNPMRTISGKKIWNDRGNVDGLRPKTITIRLLADGKEVQKLTVDKGQDGKWEFAFTNCPTYNQGTPITYTITEDKVAFYTTKIDGTTITNSHRPKPTPPTPEPPTPVEPTPEPNPEPTPTPTPSPEPTPEKHPTPSGSTTHEVPNKSVHSPKTGDSFSAMQFVVVGCCALALVFFALRNAHTRKKEREQ